MFMEREISKMLSHGDMDTQDCSIQGDLEITGNSRRC